MKFVKKIEPAFVEKYKNKIPPWGPLGYVVYKRTYSRSGEEWFQTIERCINGLLAIGGIFKQNEVEEMYDYLFNFKICFSGRALWQLGTRTIDVVGSDSLQNCWHVPINEPIYPFCFLFNQLMLGGGVGFGISKEQVYSLPKVKYGVTVTREHSADVDYIVPDNRKGWVRLLAKVLEAYFVTGRNFKYSTQAIRHKGEPISTFGGTASGSEILVWGIEKIVGVLNSRVNYKLRPLDCLDICNILGEVVVAGNVRRSAEIAIGDCDDLDFINAKNWTQKTIPSWRSKSNNSLYCENINDLPKQFWDCYNGEGEPCGLINMDLGRHYGRLYDGFDYRPDLDISGTNPCAEIMLEPYEPCNLAEIYLPNIHSTEEFIKAAEFTYKMCKVISAYPFSDPRTNAVVQKNQRLGVGCTGVLQSHWFGNPEPFNIVYESMEDLDISYSKELGVNRSIKLTTVKPSGTLSKLPGVSEGIHPTFAPYYIRRIRFAGDDSLVDKCRQHGYHVEPERRLDGTRNLDTMVVDFPIKGHGIMAEHLTAIEQIKAQEFMQTYWSDNAVSITVYYRKEELPEIKDYLKNNYNSKVKTISFLLHSEHGFIQAPLEEITESQYLELQSKCTPINGGVADGGTVFEDCVSGSCPVR